jgi:hypothetical protein
MGASSGHLCAYLVPLQFVVLSLISHLLPLSEMYDRQSQDDSEALLEACAQAVKDAGGKASATYTCLAQHADALKIPRSIAIGMAQMVVRTLIQPAALGSAALCTTGLSLGDPVYDTAYALLQHVSCMIPKVSSQFACMTSVVHVVVFFVFRCAAAVCSAGIGNTSK